VDNGGVVDNLRRQDAAAAVFVVPEEDDVALVSGFDSVLVSVFAGAAEVLDLLESRESVR
jgi:hypothetical protein